MTVDAGATYAWNTAFRPEVFFLGRTEGGGVARDPFGRVRRRCAIVTQGHIQAGHDAIQFDETFTFDDGEVDVWRWVMTEGPDGRYVAAEAVAGAGIVGERRGGDYVLDFRRAVGAARGVAAPRFVSRFTLLAPDLALKTVRVSLLGLPVGTMTAVHRRLSDPAPGEGGRRALTSCRLSRNEERP